MRNTDTHLRLAASQEMYVYTVQYFIVPNFSVDELIQDATMPSGWFEVWTQWEAA